MERGRLVTAELALSLALLGSACAGSDNSTQEATPDSHTGAPAPDYTTGEYALGNAAEATPIPTTAPIALDEAPVSTLEPLDLSSRDSLFQTSSEYKFVPINTTPLPLLQKPDWPREGDQDLLRHPIFSVYPTEDGQLTFEFYEELPQPYRDALEDMINHPIVATTRELGYITSITGSPYIAENGYFDPNLLGVDLYFTSDDRFRIFRSHADIVRVGVHEAAHGFSEAWHRAFYFNSEVDDPQLSTKLDTLRTHCNNLREYMYTSYMDANVDRIAAAIETTRQSMLNQVIAIEHDDDPSNDVLAAGYTYSAEMMSLAAIALVNPESRDRPISEEYSEDQPPCQREQIDDFIIATTREDGYPAPDDAIQNPPPSQQFEQLMDPINDIREEQAEHAAHATSCLDESKAQEALADNGQETVGGHPFDNPTEFAASLTVILTMNPEYLTNCLDALPADHAQLLAQISVATLDLIEYTTPEIYDIIANYHPEAQAAIDATARVALAA